MKVLTLTADEWAIEAGFDYAAREDRSRRLKKAWDDMPFDAKQGKDFGIGWMHRLLEMIYLDG